MAVSILWRPPLVLEERKRSKWERIIRAELGESDEPVEVSLSLESESLRWKVATQPALDRRAGRTAQSRARVVDALRAAGKPAV
jgi:hypothetical protein